MDHPTTLSEERRLSLVRLVNTHGLQRVAFELGMTADTVSRVAAGFRARPGTIALAIAGIDKLLSEEASHAA